MTTFVSKLRFFALAVFVAFLTTAGQAAEKTVKVFFLVGQSNMEGKRNPLHLDTYKEDPAIKPTYAGLKDGNGWKVRDDVWITYPRKNKGAMHGARTVGYGTKGVAFAEAVLALQANRKKTK